MIERTGPPPAPAWVAEADRALFRAFKSVSLLGHLGPKNFGAEVDRLTRAFQANGAGAPRFEYGPPGELGALRAELSRLAAELEREAALGEVYAARARELALEAAIVERRATSDVWTLAAERYRASDDAALADALATELIHSSDAHDLAPADVVTDDAGDPRSLVSRLREELGRRRLPVRVVVSPSLAALAAVGDGVVQVAAGRRVRARDVERTVLHEISGHLEPASRAKRAALGIFSFGTARGSDEQEGYALLAERRAGHLTGARGRELAVRHRAARAAHAGVRFEEAVRELARDGVDVALAVRSACRAYRGGGLGREAAYLVALVRVERALEGEPALERVLASGRVALEAVSAVDAWAVADGDPVRER